MPIINLYPYQIGGYQDWVTSSGTPANSGSYAFVDEGASALGVDSTYIVNSGDTSSIYFYFSGSGISPYLNNISRAVVRVRAKYSGAPVSNLVALENVFENSADHTSLSLLNTEGQLSSIYRNPTNEPTYYGLNSFLGNYALASSGDTDINGSSFATYDFNLYHTNYAKHPYYAGTYFKDSVVKLQAASGTYISSVEILLDADESNGFPLNITGHNNAFVKREEMDPIHYSNMRYWGINNGIHPSSVFNSYTFFDGSGNTRHNFDFVHSYEAHETYGIIDCKREQFNIYSKPLPFTSGHPSNYINAIVIDGSGSYPGCFYLDAPTSNVTSNCWSMYIAAFPKETNDVLDTWRPLIRWGGAAGWPTDNYVFSVKPVDMGHLYNYDRLEIAYTTTGGIPKTAVVSQSGFKPFHNATEPVYFLISYSGQSMGTRPTASGTMYFFVGHDVEDVHAIRHMRYVGAVSDVFYTDDRGSDSNGYLAIGGTSQHVVSGGVGGALEVNNGKLVITELGFNNVLYSGIRYVDNIPYLENSNIELLFTSRKCAQDYIVNSGDSKYIEWKWTPKYTWNGDAAASGKRVEYIHMDIGSGNPQSYQFIGSYSSTDGYVVVSPSAVYVEYLMDVHTNHPSGVDFTFSMHGYEGGGERGRLSLERTLSSGTLLHGIIHNPKIHGFDYPIAYRGKDIIDYDTLSFDILGKTHAVNNADYNTTVRLHYVRLHLDNVVVAVTGVNNIPLYVEGNNANINGSMDLYVNGHSPNTDDSDLFIKGHIANSGSTTLYIECGVPSSGSTTLYIDGIGVENTTMPMYMQGQIGVSNSGSMTLWLLGTTNSGIFEAVDLYTCGPDLYPDRQLPLVINGAAESVNDSLVLFIKHENDWAGNTTPLFLRGPDGQASGVNFFIRGLGTASGSIPANDSIPLFIHRPSEDSTDERLRLFIGGPNETVKATSMYVHGAFISQSSVPMYVQGSALPLNNFTKLYTHGY